MADVLFVVLLVVLFAVTAAVVEACDRLIGVDDDVATVPAVDDSPSRSAA